MRIVRLRALVAVFEVLSPGAVALAVGEAAFLRHWWSGNEECGEGHDGDGIHSMFLLIVPSLARGGGRCRPRFDAKMTCFGHAAGNVRRKTLPPPARSSTQT